MTLTARPANASLESAVKLPPAPTEVEAKIKAEIDAVGFTEWIRQQQQELRIQQDKMWEWRITPPPELMRTHWTTWVATVVVAVLLAGFIYLLYSAPP